MTLGCYLLSDDVVCHVSLTSCPNKEIITSRSRR